MEIGLENYEFKELERYQASFLGFGLSCHFLFGKAQGEINKIQWLQGKEKKF